MKKFALLDLEKCRRELVLHWKNYLFQCLFATAALFVVLMVLSLEHAVVIASLGATSFIIFAMPKSITANTRNVIGGYVVGVAAGGVFALIPHDSEVVSALVYAGAVGISILAMVVLDFEHPPAGGAALGVVMTGLTADVAIAVMTSVVILSSIHRVFRSYLRDLV